MRYYEASLKDAAVAIEAAVDAQSPEKFERMIRIAEAHAHVATAEAVAAIADELTSRAGITMTTELVGRDLGKIETALERLS